MQQELEVGRITRSRTKGNRKFYQLQFRGYSEPHPIWYPKSELLGCMELVNEYESLQLANAAVLIACMFLV
jgi:hypothetical protein